MASIAKRWGNPPQELQKEGGKAVDIRNMKVKTDSYVYLVKLLTFEATREGAYYYKIVLIQFQVVSSSLDHVSW